ncbi:unnamed protein product [Calypogeia fissa]
MTGGKTTYVNPGFIAAMAVLGASGVIIIALAAVFVSWCVVKYFRYLRQPSSAMIQVRNRIRETEGIRSLESGMNNQYQVGRGGIVHRGAIGVPPGFIQSLPLLKYSKSGAHLASSDLKGHMSECPVCLTEYKEQERIRLLPNCKHIFHPTCINTWLESHTTCPLCRTEVQALKHSRSQSSLDRILSLIRRSGANQVIDSSARDRYSGRQRVTVVTPPPQQHTSSNAMGPPVTINPRSSRPIRSEALRRELFESDSPPPPMPSSSGAEAGMIFSSVWGSYVDDVRSAGPSTSSSSGFTQVSVTIAGSEDGCSSAKDFVAISLDSDHPER